MSPVMDRSIEPPTPCEEKPVNVRLSDSTNNPKNWVPPVPLRLKFTGMKKTGLVYPDAPTETEYKTVRMKGTPSILAFADNAYWLVTTLCADTIPPSFDPFEGEHPLLRVDGETVKGYLTVSKTGQMILANVDIGRACQQRMADRILGYAPDSRILIRLFPRISRGAIRWYPTHRVAQFWTAL
jgi:hypothetical protein